MDRQRIRTLRGGIPENGPVVYWMRRDQRVADNWALLHAQELARERKVPLGVVFTISPLFPYATIRQYDFLLRGLEYVEHSLERYRIPFFFLTGRPEDELASFLTRHRAGALVADFSPLRIHRDVTAAVLNRLSIPVYEVDAHNVVPCWLASDKREYSAGTFRPKIHRALPTFLHGFPKLARCPIPWKGQVKRTPWSLVRKGLPVDTTVPPVEWLTPGEQGAAETLRCFIEQRLHGYATHRNNPTKSMQSNLSPYLHFGQISPQRVVLEVMKNQEHPTARDAFLEELIVRRELAENFCLYDPSYDSPECFPSWARSSLHAHRSDARKHTYSHSRLENAATCDPLWNAAQMEMVCTGKMHGYMRMYWAKKILEWTRSAGQAMRVATYLNDRYELDGCDPNGYAGIAWSIGGVHDRAWGDRAVFGKIRYMSYEGCRRKFDVEKYIATVRNRC